MRQVRPLDCDEVREFEQQEALAAKTDKRKGLRHLRATVPYVRFGSKCSRYGPLRFGGVDAMASAEPKFEVHEGDLPSRGGS